VTISVIIPAYNAETTLLETLESVLGQTLVPDEVIVIDDGSTDSTAQLAAAASSSIRVVRQPNRGAAAATNLGVELSTGTELAFLDADDLWAKDKIATQVEILCQHAELDGVFGHVNTFLCPTNDAESKLRYRIPEAPEPGWFLGAALLRRHCFECCGTFVDTLRAGFFIDWYDRARASGLSFQMRNDLVLHRRIHPGSLAHRSQHRDSAMLEMARRAIERRRARASS